MVALWIESSWLILWQEIVGKSRKMMVQVADYSDPGPNKPMDEQNKIPPHEKAN